MARTSRAHSDSQPKSPDYSRRSLQLSPRKPKHDDRREAQLESPTSPTIRKAPKKELVIEPRPSTPEGWIEFALVKLRQGALVKVIQGVLELAHLEPDLLEFLITANEEIRDAVYEAACGSTFPTTREQWTSSPSSVILERLRSYLNRLPPDLANRKVDEASRQVTLCLAALATLDHIVLGVDQPDEDKDKDEEDPFFKIKVKKSQKKRKASVGNANRARRGTVVVDPKVFAAVDLELPTCGDEILDVECTLLFRLRDTLETLFTAFENPELAVHAKALFFKQPLQFVPLKSITTTTIETTTDVGITNAPDAGAFPHIRPLATAKYFDEASGLGAWPVIVSGRAVSDLRQMQKRDSNGFAMVHKKITELSQGFFSNDNQKRLVGLGTEVPIFEAKVSRDLRIVYQIDLDTDVDAKVDKQIIKLYGVYTHAQLDNRMWSLVSHYHINRRGKEYRRRCGYRATHRAPGQNVTMPAQFKHDEDMEVPVEMSPNEVPNLEGMTEKDFLDLHSLIALEKFIPMSQSLVNSILNDSDASHVFHVSAKEKEIIYHDSACFVLGRSGTGKTTSILFKMIGIEKLFERMEEVTKPRQVFVTQSRVLAQRVQEYYQNLVRSASEALNKTPKPAEDEEQVLADLDDEDADAFGLPPKYSMLEDHHFPLFLTYDQLCSLLEADFGLKFRRSARTRAHAAAEKRFAITEVADVKIDLDKEVEPEPSNDSLSSPIDNKEDVLQAQRAAVTFEIFVAAYWPHFDFRLTKGFDPALVYSEFLGVIEGSEAALASKSGSLTREEYASLSHRKSSFASQRDRVYDLYEIYRKRKQQLGGYDAAERTHALVAALNDGIPGVKLDCLYVDEAQDNLLIDIKLLHTLSNNPHGIFMAGDTAQTISAGSAFRFEDLKAFMWRLEEQDEAVRCGKRNAIHPALFHLAVNYRSHGGIVDCASSVVQLISDLFPYSIDKLSKETGLIDGPKPIFFSGWDSGVVRFEQFLRGEADTKIDFGASQVILVRNEAARSALRAQVGEIGLILTLYESKGLEFDDVLLYNFFEDSVPTASTWRVILHGLQGANLGPTPRFDEIRHAVICTELKNLYVGLTRARNHCWIWDVSDKAEPMKMFWKQQNLVTICGPKDQMPQLSVSSSEADWAKSGRLLFNKGLYPQAMFCFEKAQLFVEHDIAGAYQARKEARLLLAKSVDRQTRRGAFKKAADDFLGCAILSKGKQRTSCYLRAAECYLQAEDWKSAAESYLSAEQYDLAAKNFRRAGCFEQAVDIVKKYRERLKSRELVDEIYAIARLEFLRKSQYQKASGLFDDVEEQLEYMEDFGFNAARIHVLELHERFSDAATVALQEQNVLEGVRLLLLSPEGEHRLQAVEHSIHGLWTLLPYGSSVTMSNQTSIGAQRQLDLFQVLHDKNLDRTLALARSNALLSRAPEALLAFAHCSKHLTILQNIGLDDFNTKSTLALSYYNGLLQLARTFKISTIETQRLLGFEPVKSNVTSEEEEETGTSEFWIYSSSFMFEPAKNVLGNQEPTPLALGLSAVIVPESDLQRLIVESTYKRLKHEVGNTNVLATAVRGLRPCLDFGLFGNCTRPNCGRQEVSSIQMTDLERQKYFNLRLRAHILQVLVIQAYPPQDYEDQKLRNRNIRIWIEKIYETLFPHFPPLGNVLCVDPKLVQELDRAADTLSRWCEHRLYELNPAIRATQPSFLAEVLSSLELGCRIKRKIFESYAAKLHSCRLIRDEAILVSPVTKRSIVHDLIDYYGDQTENALQGVLAATQHIVNRSLSVEINVFVHLLESIGRDIIMQARTMSFVGTSDARQSQVWAPACAKALDGLFIPRSWALDIVQNPPKRPQIGWTLPSYLDTLYEVLNLLKFDDPDRTPFYVFNAQMGILFRGVMIIRICRLLILIADNLGYHLKNQIRLSIMRVLNTTSQGSIHNQLCGPFARTNHWSDLVSALIEGPLNRGVDELVRLTWHGSRSPRNIPGIKPIIYETIRPGLEAELAFVAQNLSRGPMLNPEAKAFVLGQKHVEKTQANPPSTDKAGEEPTDIEKSDPFDGLVPSQLTFKIPVSPVKNTRVVTDQERIAVTKILQCYRGFRSRQQTRARQAIHIIWAYYVRYRRRRQAASVNNEDAVRKLHNEYKRTVEDIECPLLLDKVFRIHEMLLQGPMPHVLIYLRGLERINQRQKDATKKRLRKVQHEELEKVQARMTVCSTLAKRFKRLYPRIQPGSDALRKLSSLKERVSEVVALRNEIIDAFGESCISANLEAHYSLGVQVILVPSPEPTAPQPQKPELNTQDIGEMF